MITNNNPRFIATKIINDVLTEKTSLTSALQKHINECKGKDKSLCQAICFGVFRQFEFLTAVLAKLLSKELPKKENFINCLLLAGVYELAFMQTPEYAAVNEIILAAKKTKKKWATGLLNAVLRNFLRQKDIIIESIKNNLEAQYLHPNWLLTKLKNQYSDNWQNICLQNNLHPPMCIRINQQLITRENYLQLLKDNNMEANYSNFSKFGIYLHKPCNVEKLPGFTEGLVSIQDEAGQLCAEILDLKNEQDFLDACAAPGSKLCHALEINPNLNADAIDLDPKRLELIKENLIRLQVKAQVFTGNLELVEKIIPKKTYSRILLDAPCSATGVIRRHPDIKILRRESDIEQLANTQLSLLKAIWPKLKTKGKLLYATCSILNEENDEVINQFLKEEKTAFVIEIKIEPGQKNKFGRQLLPQENAHDGFYYCLLGKN